MTQKEAVVAALSGKKRLTMDQLVTAVQRKTKKSATIGSLNVVMCHLRQDGVNIVTYYRGDAAKPTRYIIE